MFLKLKIKSRSNSNYKQLFVWIQNYDEFRNEIKQVLEFFKDQIILKKKYRFHKYYRVTSENPAIMLSLLSTIQDLIPEIYFNANNDIDIDAIENLSKN
ncbi:hypothetical protein LCGC14_0590870 [marine sediment metagenome]|uniref:Homing endonuclease LAGLIDADG domain-containing protein n=1 Tax=marine sediment metagenome TaxID=412755 RepID=A0A0F9ULZ9_9ZZZZ|nr:hypothetical protein [archaeon]